MPSPYRLLLHLLLVSRFPWVSLSASSHESPSSSLSSLPSSSTMLLPNVHVPRISFPSLTVHFPSSTSLLLSLLATFTLLAFVRATLCLKTYMKVKGQSQHQESGQAREKGQTTWSPSWRVFSWESLPLTLPVSLSVVEKDHKAASHSAPVEHSPRAPQNPQTSIYGNQPPISMAKMIMSRHTFRKPTQRPPRPPPTLQQQVQYTLRRQPSMV
ncbi:hypothetical protein BD779DRAFT_1128227 [Infundibulicybe gibba]|nr:hypothetical protein BD779DRAFT_1128227 [Infundibulicybe gibba]